MENIENSQSCQSDSGVPNDNSKQSKNPVEMIEVESVVEQQPNDDFPGWFQFLFILVALILGMFLVGVTSKSLFVLC